MTVASFFSTDYGNYSPSVINFLIFASVWSLLVLIYIGVTPLYMTSVFHRLAALVLNVLTAIFWFAGAIALAVAVGVPNLHSVFTNSAQAAVAFAFFLWIIFTFLAVLDGLESLRRRGHSTKTTQSTNAYPGA
ncbi:hypothetical protein F5Y18DRAFT_396266 [Xylariaceae sp. FL1019]|nr:hypothetical protein F5Y18DRAFT_396266 [Xylariaceae sp. FL1019]